jgi:hypothetical protein
MTETLIGMATVVGLLVWAFLVFEKLSAGKKANVIYVLISGCVIAGVILLWHPASIGDVPLARLTRSAVAANLTWGLLVIVCGLSFLGNFWGLLR